MHQSLFKTIGMVKISTTPGINIQHRNCI